MKRVCLINTGGTIGMRLSPQGLVPEPGYLAKLMAKMQELAESPMPDYEIIEYDPVIDSADMRVEQWRQIAQDIALRYNQFDGFVVLHGTDTLAYTASALPFMLANLAKPVILTGSQLPLGQVRNDARENLKTAMMFAADYPVPEVAVFFGERLLRGCRSTKTSASRLDAFDSPNYPPLAFAETSIELFPERIRQPAGDPSQPLEVQPLWPVELATFRLFPGMSVDVLRNLLQRPLRALILESYGVGNGPTSDPEFLAALRSATDAGTVIVTCTQCRHGAVSQAAYAAGRALADCGVLSGADMTIEAAIAKLFHLFSLELPLPEVKRLLGVNLVGELTDGKL
jgi:L-asparaginase